MNSRGDVEGIYDATGELVCEYSYDAWGRLLGVTGSAATTVGAVNPIRCRGYYYDTETGLYYLQSRYYDPEVCRFINADIIIGANQDLLCYNIFAYCSNNPVFYNDPSGVWKTIGNTIYIDSKFIYDTYYTDRSKFNNNVYILDIGHVKYNAAIKKIKSKEQAFHYARNMLNKDIPYTLPPENSKDWNDSKAACHQFSDPKRENVKRISVDGHLEGIYDSSGYLVTDPRDIGTYNFYSPDSNPIGHMMIDVLPWIMWGNSPEDTTTPIQRALSFISIYIYRRTEKWTREEPSTSQPL